MALHNFFGNEAEEKAVDFLKKNQFKILSRNFRFQKAEIDIIAQQKDLIVVVEVKARDFSSVHQNQPKPEDAVNHKKKQLLVMAADSFLEQNNLDLEVRFDVISILKKQDHWQIKHITNAFQPHEL